MFQDNKEGLFAIRVDRAFTFPSDKPQIFTDANGIPSEVEAMGSEGMTGHYVNSKGEEDGDVGRISMGGRGDEGCITKECGAIQEDAHGFDSSIRDD